MLRENGALLLLKARLTCKDDDERCGKTKTLRLLWRLVLMHNGLDWIFTVVVLAQRDDSVSTSPKGGYDCLSIWWYDTLTA